MASNYVKRMAWLSSKIFGDVSRPTNPTSMKVVQMFAEEPLNTRKDIAEYYPHHPEINGLMFNLRKLGLFRDEHLDFKEEMRRLRALRGKVKPKKGEGKRALKRK